MQHRLYAEIVAGSTRKDTK